MKTASPFTIYNASAGSGKTFTLVKEYLKIVLLAKPDGYYKHLLAITFTNKAVAEMKQRIIKTLVSFSNSELLTNPSPIALAVSNETGLEIKEINTKSIKILKHLLHNYSAFSVETIDRFNHRLIRTFARDLKLSSNFEVFLDTPQLLTEAVNRLINQAGEDPKITKVLLDFALEKIDDDKSWDISKDIASASKLLFNENESSHVDFLKEKTLQDFLDFRNQLRLKIIELSSKTVQVSNEALQLIDESGLQHSDFSSGYFPKYLQKLASGNTEVNFKTKWQETFGEIPLYSSKVSINSKATLDSLAPTFVSYLIETKTLVRQLWLTESIFKNITPLSVINLVNQQLEIIQNEKNIVPVSRFNALINAEIKEQPAPFIYERLGEKYWHFFIDEFQDTSLLQWENLIPLIENALSQQGSELQGSLLLVGDAKQSIYRWRGGLPEQFMGLCLEENPFVTVEKEKVSLETNYRSCKEIIDFNNRFFTFIADYFFKPKHNFLYKEGNHQNFSETEGGYIKVEFIENQKKAETNEIYAQKVFETIDFLMNNGYKAGDICILTRAKKDGIFIGAHLTERGISVVSSETLLLQSSPLVQIIILTLTLGLYPNYDESKVKLLDLLHEHLSIPQQKHEFFIEFLNFDLQNFSKKMKAYSIEFNFETSRSASLYENCEYIIRQFKLDEFADAYVFGFMDLVYEFQQQPMADLISFLDFWETKKESAAIAAGEGTDAIRLMTIHKAKGLEFPVVLFPFADIDIYKTIEAKVWYPLDSDDFSFSEAQINYKSEIEEYSEIGADLYQDYRATLELDNINLLYVTLTRAVEKLYVFAQTPSNKSESEPKNYNQFFKEFLKQIGNWDDEETVYEFGNFQKNAVINKEEKVLQIEPKYSISTENITLAIVEKDALLWETPMEQAIIAGNLLHGIMEQIKSEADVPLVFEEMEKRALVSKNEIEFLRQKVTDIITHPELKLVFSPSRKVMNEREIITLDRQLLRPDRLVFHENNSVIIVDFKTGIPKKQHSVQIMNYALALQEMGFEVSEKILVYTSGEEIIINKV